MNKLDKLDYDEIFERIKASGKRLKVVCPRVTYTVETETGRKVKKTYFDITEVFNDWEEGKALGRDIILGGEKNDS